jgi:hypothetical protein
MVSGRAPTATSTSPVARAHRRARMPAAISTAATIMTSAPVDQSLGDQGSVEVSKPMMPNTPRT